MTKKRAFTLIELLVAMAIIAVLIGLSVFGINQGFRSSRDTQRRALLDEIQKGIATFQGQYFFAPVSITANTGDGESTIIVGDAAGKHVEVPFAFKVVKSTGVNHAITTDEAVFCYNPNATTGYALGTKLESTNDWYYITANKCY